MIYNSVQKKNSRKKNTLLKAFDHPRLGKFKGWKSDFYKQIIKSRKVFGKY